LVNSEYVLKYIASFKRVETNRPQSLLKHKVYIYIVHGLLS